MTGEARILLLRHAETSAPDRYHGGESDVPLGDRGFRQAEAAGRFLASSDVDSVSSSTMLRARQTAAAIASALGMEPRILPDLHERLMGPLSGRLKSEGHETYRSTADSWLAGDLDATHEGGESFAQIRDRVLPAFRKFADEHLGKTAVLVVHGVVIKVLMTSLVEGLSPADYDRVGIGFVAVHELLVLGDRWRLASPEDLIGRRVIDEAV